MRYLPGCVNFNFLFGIPAKKVFSYVVDMFYTIKFTRSTLGYRTVLILDSQQDVH